ncbi:MAG: hypothetical protein V8Q87_08460 [Blautia wexlerae]
MSKRTERMSRSAAERINRKDTVIRQNNAELEELRSQYENLDICEEDKQVIDDYIACKDARADRMAEKLYEKGRKDVKRMYPHPKTDPQMHDPVCHCYGGTDSV